MTQQMNEQEMRKLDVACAELLGWRYAGPDGLKETATSCWVAPGREDWQQSPMPTPASENSPDALKVLKWCYKNVGNGTICTYERRGRFQIWSDEAAVEGPTPEIALCRFALQLAKLSKEGV